MQALGVTVVPHSQSLSDGSLGSEVEDTSWPRLRRQTHPPSAKNIPAQRRQFTAHKQEVEISCDQCALWFATAKLCQPKCSLLMGSQVYRSWLSKSVPYPIAQVVQQLPLLTRQQPSGFEQLRQDKDTSSAKIASFVQFGRPTTTDCEQLQAMLLHVQLLLGVE